MIVDVDDLRFWVEVNKVYISISYSENLCELPAKTGNVRLHVISSGLSRSRTSKGLCGAGLIGLKIKGCASSTPSKIS